MVEVSTLPVTMALGRWYYEIGLFDLAARYFEEALALAPFSGEIKAHLLRCERLRKKTIMSYE
jgi:tetratricopeptide (TPR) repeat protein